MSFMPFFAVLFGIFLIIIILGKSSKKYREVLDLEAELVPVEGTGTQARAKAELEVYENLKTGEQHRKFQAVIWRSVAGDRIFVGNPHIQILINGEEIRSFRGVGKLMQYKKTSLKNEDVPSVEEGDRVEIIANGQAVFRGVFQHDR